MPYPDAGTADVSSLFSPTQSTRRHRSAEPFAAFRRSLSLRFSHPTLRRSLFTGLRSASEEPALRPGAQSRELPRFIRASPPVHRERFCAPFLRVPPAPRLPNVPPPWPITKTSLAVVAWGQHATTPTPDSNLQPTCAPESAAVRHCPPLTTGSKEIPFPRPILSQVSSELIRTDRCNGTIATLIARRAYATVQAVPAPEYRSHHQSQNHELSLSFRMNLSTKSHFRPAPSSKE
jgi:hypothetical protein